MTAKHKYEIVEHTADVGISVQAGTLEELFANAAYGMSDLLCKAETVCQSIERPILIEANDYEELMVKWLTELLFLFETEKLLFSEFQITEIDKTHLRAIARGELLSPDRHEMNFDIKAVTWYGLHVVRDDSQWTARIIFDI